MVSGDLAVFYAGLAATLILRYGFSGLEIWWLMHLFPFSALFAGWILIFIIAGLYEPFSFSASAQVRERIIRAVLVGGAIGIAVFYVMPQPGITPKTNLLIDLVVTAFLLILWRKLYNWILSRSDKIKTVFFGLTDETKNLINFLKNSPHLGYEPVCAVIPAQQTTQHQIGIPVYVFDHDLPKIVLEKRATLVIASLDIRGNFDFIKMIYEVLPLGIAYLNFAQFYENITGKIPVSMISEMWFLENLTENEKRGFEIIKRAMDLTASLILGVVAVIIFPFVAAAIKLTSSGPILFRQKRVGKNGRLFELIKFRTMVKNAENGRAVWAKENDIRVTSAGHVLRKTRLDELPQIWNVIKGEMSLMGPRPERPEFIEELKKQIPHYMMRLLVRPGLSGWAQINFPYGASVEDAMEKLQYDLYYIKNRSLGLDISTALKTLFIMVSRSGR